MGLRIHKREQLVRKAEIDLMEVQIAWMKRHPDLTYIEQAMVFADVLNPMTPLKYALREERHGNDRTPGGLAPANEQEEG